MNQNYGLLRFATRYYWLHFLYFIEHLDVLEKKLYIYIDYHYGWLQILAIRFGCASFGTRLYCRSNGWRSYYK